MTRQAVRENNRPLFMTMEPQGNMKKTRSRRVSVPSTALLADVDSVLQWFREKARAEGRRSDAQHYADTQRLILRQTSVTRLHADTVCPWDECPAFEKRAGGEPENNSSCLSNKEVDHDE